MFHYACQERVCPLQYFFRKSYYLEERAHASPFAVRIGATMAAKRDTRSSWEQVFRFVKSIPRGHIVSYGELARALRLKGGARTAGRAMAATPRGRGIPWHRVLGAGGRILVREPYASLQRRLLESEGVCFIEGRVDWKRHAWKKLRGGARIALRSARASVLRFSNARPR